MDNQPVKKGMSRGCLVGLIVLGVIVVLIVIAGIVCYTKRDDLMKFALNTGVTTVKAKIVDSPIAGIDTTEVNRTVASFTERFETEPVDMVRYQRLLSEMQAILSDDAVDSLEAEQFLESLENYFDRDSPPVETATEADTIVSEPEPENSL